jgi:FtsH-binding integral membrane protein
MELEKKHELRDGEITVDQVGGIPRTFVANVFSWMVLGLAITGVMSWVFGTSDLIQLIISPTGGFTIFGWVALLAPFAFIIAMNMGLERWSPMTLIILFLAFSAVMGISLSTIFLRFNLGSIITVFAITSATFGVMAVVGYTTKTDLTKFGSILMMGLVGIIIAMVVNFFVQSGPLDYLISCIGVLIFTGLTAYDVQRIKRIGAGVEYGSATAMKLTILGATSLYLDFINLFLFLLRIFGGRD